MQSCNSSQNLPPPSILDQVYARVRARVTGERPPPIPEPVPIGEAPGTGERTAGDLLDGAEVLRVLREPVESILALAHQLAGDDPIDRTAVARLRAAFRARLAGHPTKIPKRDLLVVLGLVMEALETSVVVRAVSDSIGDGAAAVLGPESPLAPDVGAAVDPLASLMELLAAFRSQRFGGHGWLFSVHPSFSR